MTFESALSAPDENEIPNAVSEPQSAILKFGQRAVGGARGKAVCGIGRGDRIEQRAFVGEHRQHLLRVVFPVGGAVNVAAGFEAARQQADEGRLDQAALVVARLVPGIGKKDMDAGQRVFRQHVADYSHGIVRTNTQVA